MVRKLRAKAMAPTRILGEPSDSPPPQWWLRLHQAIAPFSLIHLPSPTATLHTRVG
ncbi:hypothetical protein H6G89_00020 [Oscillatoria sp. FACHB-1407]|uniref:hypothetical protein n=1 Tax=Oscillatoria sp. FACHB-1407 TaxID=2692847 RepID=UPI001688CAEF|nr:hypothetical protein [Oscillatoria sp. FACHB-1407]MBD2459416.1 hypothetical protein [Oscillatoria sp. FACHB-1407]